jgi:hypothetical protein
MGNKEIADGMYCLKAMLTLEHIKPTDYVRKTVDSAIAIFDKVESGQLVEVVHCKDCKSWLRVSECRSDGWCKCLEEYHDSERPCTEKDHFCSYGERKDGAEK